MLLCSCHHSFHHKRKKNQKSQKKKLLGGKRTHTQLNNNNTAQMALFKLLFLFTLVVVYRREWLEKQLARHLRSLKLFLGPWWPLHLGGATAASVVDLSWANQTQDDVVDAGAASSRAKGAAGVVDDATRHSFVYSRSTLCTSRRYTWRCITRGGVCTVSRWWREA